MYLKAEVLKAGKEKLVYFLLHLGVCFQGHSEKRMSNGEDIWHSDKY